MNLADAIRKAAYRGLSVGHETGAGDGPNAKDIFTRAHTTEDPKDDPMKHQEDHAPSASPIPEPPSPALAGGNAVRLEIFLSGEQMCGMLKAIMAGQHSVLTLREAASYLRLSPSKLERLVDDGDIPAVDIDGRYRFPKSNLDDWLASQSIQSEDEKNVA